MLPWFMAKTSVVTKKRRGPPPTGKGMQIGERWHPPEIAAIDRWIASQGEEITRGQAIRQLVELGLKVKTPARPVSKPGRRLRAQELAPKEIEKIIDPSAHAQEPDLRRRGL